VNVTKEAKITPDFVAKLDRAFLKLLGMNESAPRVVEITYGTPGRMAPSGSKIAKFTKRRIAQSNRFLAKPKIMTRRKARKHGLPGPRGYVRHVLQQSERTEEDRVSKEVMEKLAGLVANYPKLMAEGYSVQDATPFSGVMLTLHFDTAKEADEAEDALDEAGFYCDLTCEDELCVYTGFQSPDQAIAHVQRVLMSAEIELDGSKPMLAVPVGEGKFEEAKIAAIVAEDAPAGTPGGFFAKGAMFEFVGLSSGVDEEDDEKDKEKGEAEDDDEKKKKEADDKAKDSKDKDEGDAGIGPDADELMTKFFGNTARVKGSEVGKNEADKEKDADDKKEADGDPGKIGQDANDPDAIRVKGGEVGKNKAEADKEDDEKGEAEDDDKDAKGKKAEADDEKDKDDKPKGETEDDDKDEDAYYEGAVKVARLARVVEGKPDGFADLYLDGDDQIVAAEAFDAAGRLVEKIGSRAQAKAVFGKAFGKGKSKSSSRNKNPQYYQKFRVKYAGKHGLSKGAAAVGNRSKKGGKKESVEAVSPLAALAAGLAEAQKPPTTPTPPKPNEVTVGGFTLSFKGDKPGAAHTCESCGKCVTRIRTLQAEVARLESVNVDAKAMIEALSDLNTAQAVEYAIKESVAKHPEIASAREKLLACKTVESVAVEVNALLESNKPKPPVTPAPAATTTPAATPAATTPPPVAEGANKPMGLNGVSVQSTKTENAPKDPASMKDAVDPSEYFGSPLRESASTGNTLSRVASHRRRLREGRK
jgi:hypothetical protein